MRNYLWESIIKTIAFAPIANGIAKERFVLNRVSLLALAMKHENIDEDHRLRGTAVIDCDRDSGDAFHFFVLNRELLLVGWCCSIPSAMVTGWYS